MTIQSVGSGGSIAGTHAPRTSSEDYSGEIKALQDQKTGIQKQIDELKAGKQSQEIKDKQIKILQQQITELDAEIQQKQMAQAKSKVEGNVQQNHATPAQNAESGDRVEISGQAVQSQLQLTELYDKAGKLASMNKTAKGQAAALASDAEIAAGNGNEKVAATLGSESGRLSATASSAAIDAAHEASKVVHKQGNVKTGETPKRDEDRKTKDSREPSAWQKDQMTSDGSDKEN